LANSVGAGRVGDKVSGCYQKHAERCGYCEVTWKVVALAISEYFWVWPAVDSRSNLYQVVGEMRLTKL